MEDITIKRADEPDRRGIAVCIAEGFEADFSVLCKSVDKISKAIHDGIHISQFYVAITEGMVAGVAAVSSCHGRAVSTNGKAYRKNFGLFKGLLAKLVLKGEFEKQLPYGETTGYIEFVAVRKAYRGKGIATAMLKKILADGQYEEYILDVTNINTPAIECYQKIGFQEFKREKQPHGKQMEPSFDEKIFMRISPDRK